MSESKEAKDSLEDCGYHDGDVNYKPSGDEIWARQVRLRATRQEGDQLQEMQRIQYEQLLEDTRDDRELCEAAYKAHFLNEPVEGTLNQKEKADMIRQQSERVGCPWRGLTVEELIQILGEEAESKREIICQLIEHLLALDSRSINLADMANERESLLQAAHDDVKCTIQEHFAEIIRAVQQRESDLFDAAQEIFDRRGFLFRQSVSTAQSARTKIKDLLQEANQIKGADDLGLLWTLYQCQSRLEGDLNAVDASIRSAKRELDDDEATALATNESKGGEGGQLGASAIPAQFDELLVQMIRQHGTVGGLNDVEIQLCTISMLEWDESRGDSKALKLSNDRRAVTHVAKRDQRATMFAKSGFSSGTFVFRVCASGLKETQWLAVGLATATKLNIQKAFIRDTLILEAARRESGDENPSQISNDSIVTIVCDCESMTVSYYKNNIRVKFSQLELTSSAAHPKSPSGATEKQLFFPYCTLFHPGQCLTLLQ